MLSVPGDQRGLGDSVTSSHQRGGNRPAELGSLRSPMSPLQAWDYSDFAFAPTQAREGMLKRGKVGNPPPLEPLADQMICRRGFPTCCPLLSAIPEIVLLSRQW